MPIFPPAPPAAAYVQVDALIDLDNYIDYMICNTYVANDDWCGNNWRAAKRHAAGYKWRFLIWDVEWALRHGEHIPGMGGFCDSDPARFFACPGPAEIHAGLKDYEPYRQRYSARIKKHFFVDSLDSASGALAMVNGVDRWVQLFQNEMPRFEAVLFSESARWGNMDAVNSNRTAPMTKSDPTYMPDKPYGDWDRNTAYRVNVWLPERRAYFLSRMQAVGLYIP